MINELLRKLDNRALRWLLILLIRAMYKLRTNEDLQKVFYHRTFRLWGYQLKNKFFWNVGPGWITGKKHFESVLLHYFANQYQPKKGDVIIDLGAGVGEEMIVLSDWVGDQGHVYAIEATPRIAEALKFAKDVNHLKNVSISNIAISDKNGPVDIADESGYVGNTINSVVESQGHTFKVPGMTLDDFFRNQQISKVDLLKVNIEGAEQFMIKGMDNAVTKIKNIAISCHDFRHTNNNESEFYMTMDQVKSYFDSKGFSTLVLPSDDILQRHILFGKNVASNT